MKKVPQQPSNQTQSQPEKQPSPFFLALLLTGILAMEMNPTLISKATANAGALHPPRRQLQEKSELKRKELLPSFASADVVLASDQKVQGKLAEGDRSNRSQQLPAGVAAAVRQEVSRQTKIPAGELKITQFSHQSWPDSCLGLAKAGEFCGQMVVDGWRVGVSDGRQSWVYRTDAKGRVLRMESQKSSAKLPEAVANAVLRSAAQESGLAVAGLRVIEAKRQTWPDGCLGLGNPGVVCSQVLVPGWQVMVGSGERRWVYRTDDGGLLVMFEEGGTAPEKIPAGELPPPLTKGMVFRAVASGGIAGRTYEMVLMEDGRLMRVLLGPENANDAGRQVFRVSVQQVKEFQALLSQLQLARFHGLSFPAPAGAADFMTVTVTSGAGSVRYADIVGDRLPSALREAIQGWSRMIRTMQ